MPDGLFLHHIKIMHIRLFSILLTAVTALLVLTPSSMAQGRRTVSYASQRGVTIAYLYEEVDIHPSFPGGDRKMYSFINSERRYPQRAYEDGIEGRVLCSVIIDREGNIGHIEVVRGIEESLDREAVRIIEAMPRWEPGCIDGEPVPTFCLIPVSFRK